MRANDESSCGSTRGQEAAATEIFWHRRWPATFLERHKILNFEYTAYYKYLRISKMYKERTGYF